MAKPRSVIEEAFVIFDESVKEFVSDTQKRLRDVELPPVPEKRAPNLVVQPQPPEGLR